MGLPKLDRHQPPIDLAAMEERLKRFDAEREATNTWLKSTFPDLAPSLAAKPATAPGVAPAGETPAGVKGHGGEDVYEKPGRTRRADSKPKNQDPNVPPVGRPQQKKLRTLAEAIEQETKKDDKIAELLSEGFAQNDFIDHMRDSSAAAKAKSFELNFAELDNLSDREREMEKRDRERAIEAEAMRQKDDMERQRRDDDARRARDDADRQRRDADDAIGRQRDLDTQNARRDAERRDQEYRDAQRRADEDRMRAERDRNR